MMPADRSDSLSRLAWFTLGWNILVILWGAVVRATGSGAGCGAHWPTCNGSVVPIAPSIGTLIEFSHRATSGIALLLVFLLLHRVFAQRTRGHLARFWAVASAALILSEAAIGAGLVLYKRVASDTSTARGFWISGHLVNTFVLLAALTLTAHFSRGLHETVKGGLASAWRATFSGRAADRVTLFAALALMATGVSGAIAALGDTLFKAATLTEAIAQDFSPASHLFLRLRVFHPVIALISGGSIFFVAYRIMTSPLSTFRGRRRGLSLAGLVVGQWFLGITNLALLAPTWLQIPHLLVADLIWISLILIAVDRDEEDPSSGVAALAA